MSYADPLVKKVRQKELNRIHYLNNKEVYIQRALNRKTEIRKWFKEYKSKLACDVCGENHPACMDFHHINPKEKDTDVCRMVNRGYAIDRIIREIDRCQVLCSNCHKKKHYTG